MKRFLIGIFAGLILCSWLSVSCSAECGDTEADRIVYVRERLHPGVTPNDLSLLSEWLRNGTHSCPFSGDLWYYRGLVSGHLGDAADSKYALDQATRNRSEAQAKKFNPMEVVDRGPVTSASRHGYREKYALLVGVQDMEFSDEMLQFAAKDARDLGGYLVHTARFKPENVTVLVDKDATTQKIREAFGDIRQKAKPDDLVVIYFSSHGRPRDLDPTGLSYVLTYDTDTRSSAKVFSTALQMVELAELGRWVLARDYVLLLDTCYSGAARAGVAGKIVPPGSNGLDPLQGLDGSGNRVVLSASRADETSYEDQEHKHGYFTRYLMDALGEKPWERSLDGIYKYLDTHLPDEVAKVDKHQQHPVMQAFGAGAQIELSTAPQVSRLQTVPLGSRAVQLTSSK
jgi:hypothetical protein